jgi:putative membrane protein
MFARALSVAALAAALSATPLLAQDVPAKPAGDATPVMTMDRETFLRMVASSNTWEIESSKLAKENAEAAGIKEAAEMIIADHEKAAEKLAMTLEGKGVKAPEPVLNAKHQKMLDQLKAAMGAEFDMLYLDMQAQAHMEAVALFRTYAGAPDDQELGGFAKETLPALESHFHHVKMLVAGM